MSPALLRTGLGLLAASLLLPATAEGQTALEGPSDALIQGRTAPEASGVIDLPRLNGPITLDGLSDEPAWQEIEPLPLTMYQPTFRGEAARNIEIRVAYDDEAIYMSGRFYQNPEDIRAFSYTRDRYGGDDGLGLLLDTFNDNENAVRFNGLPLGTRMDMAVSGDGIDGGPGNTSWNTYWDFETQITEDGWFGEMRVPFSSLRFRTEPDGSVVMGMLGFALQSGFEGRFTYPAMSPDLPYARPSRFQKIRLRDIQPTNPVYVSPYVLAGSNRQAELTALEDRFVVRTEDDFEVGGEVKLTPTPNLTLDLTVNTDFAAVEADRQQVNLTRFSLFFEEKRPFFQERAGIFEFETGADRSTLFYSRRIGLGEDRLPVRILGGARVVGRLGGWDVGLIDMQTANDRGLRSENFGVLRLRRGLINTNSFVGAMATSRVDVDGAYNVSYGLDGLFRLTGDEYLTLKWLQTIQGGEATRDAAAGGLEAGRVVIDWTRRRNRGLSYQHSFVWSGPGFDPAVGFDPRSDFKRGQSDWNYNWLPADASAFRRIWLGVTSNAWIRNADGRVDTGEISPFLQIESDIGMIVKLSSKTSYEDVPAAFDLSDEAVVPAGTYWATEGAAQLTPARAWPIRPRMTLTAGQFFDGNRVGLNTDIEWPASRYLTMQGAWEWNRIRFDGRGQEFDTNLLSVTVRGALNTRLSAFVFGQYNSTTDEITTNTRLRYNFREGQDLWIVWNEGLNMERSVVGLPRLPLEQARTLTLKYTHTFIF